MFPSSTGGLRCPSSLHKPWLACLRAAGIKDRFTVHGLRRTFVDLARRARVDSVVTRSLTGHVTEKMRIHYSSVGMDEQRSAVAAVADLVRARGDRGGDRQANGTRSG
jgi:integrase